MTCTINKLIIERNPFIWVCFILIILIFLISNSVVAEDDSSKYPQRIYIRNKISIGDGTTSSKKKYGSKQILTDDIPLIIKPRKKTEYSTYSEFSKTVSDHHKVNKSVESIVKWAPSVVLTEFGAEGQSNVVQIRGSSASQVPVFFDGFSMSGFSGRTDLTLFDTESLETIDVVRGMTSSIYGPGALGGVISLRSVSPKNIESVLRIGSFSSHSLSVLTPINEIGASLFLKRAYAKNDYVYLNDRGTQFEEGDDYFDTRKNSDVLSESLFFKMELLKAFKVSLKLNRFDKGSAGTITNPSFEAREVGTSFFSSLSYSQNHLNLTSFYSGNEKTFSDPLGEFNGAAYSVTHVDRKGGVKFASDSLFGVNTINYSLGTIREFLERGDGLTSIYRNQYDATVEWNPRPFFSGVYSNFSAQLGKVSDSAPLAAIHFSNRFIKKGFPFIFRVSVGTGYRFPSLSEKYDRFGFLYPNPDLKPENGIETEASVTYSTKRFRMDAIVFYRDMTDLIEFDFASSFMMKFKNIGKSQIKGLEIIAAGNNFGFDWESQLTVTEGIDKTDNSARYDNKLLIPKYVALTKISKKLTESLTVYGESYFEDRGHLDKQTSVDIDDKSVVSVGGSFKIGTSFFKEYVVPKSTSVEFKVSNIFDALNQDRFGFPLPGRKWEVGLITKL
ncbi:TonB-dependent receptor [bacterium]|nr:TonB-dependent receptor [bacterium]